MKFEYEFVETDIFSKRIQEILADEDYALLQAELSRVPTAGPLIPSAGGLRKLRWSGGTKGKRGGLRIIYYYVAGIQKFYMIYVHRKAEQADLTA